MNAHTITQDVIYWSDAHPSQFPGHIVEMHPTMPSMARRRALDCRTGEIIITGFKSAGNHSTYAVIHGEEVVVYPYGHSIRNALELNI